MVRELTFVLEQLSMHFLLSIKDLTESLFLLMGSTASQMLGECLD